MLPVAIMAGGLGTRLQPITSSIPKSLVEVKGEPFIVHQLRLLRANQIERAVVCVGYLGEMIREAIGEGSVQGVQINYAFDGSTPRGTAGAIKNALPLLGEAFFVLYGDSYLPCDYRAVQTAFLEGGKQGLMTVFRNEGLFDKSNVEFDDGAIVAYEKKNPTVRMHYIDYGLGVFQASAFGEIPDGVAYDLAAIYQDLLKRGQLAGFEIKQRFYEIGSLQGLQDTAEFLAQQTGER
jgi:N-acetyl-alpha-D-muramate 1-phosphate uridylyltransferase